MLLLLKLELDQLLGLWCRCNNGRFKCSSRSTRVGVNRLYLSFRCYLYLDRWRSIRHTWKLFWRHFWRRSSTWNSSTNSTDSRWILGWRCYRYPRNIVARMVVYLANVRDGWSARCWLGVSEHVRLRYDLLLQCGRPECVLMYPRCYRSMVARA